MNQVQVFALATMFLAQASGIENDSEECSDAIPTEKCFYFKKYRACETKQHVERMRRDCKRTCGFCSHTCVDKLEDHRCALMERSHACWTHYERMKSLCPRTCGFCDPRCADSSPGCWKMKWLNHCLTDPLVQRQCKETCGLCVPITPCDRVRCPAGQKCFLNAERVAECRCHITCDETKRTGPVCSSTGRTFSSLCEMQKEECNTGQKIFAKTYGTCEEDLTVCEDAKRESQSGLCLAWKKSNMCDVMKSIMETYCAKTCGHCRQPSPPACANSLHGCCWDNNSKAATGPNGEGCRDCTDLRLCGTFASQCGSRLNGEFMKLNCPRTCNYCQPAASRLILGSQPYIP